MKKLIALIPVLFVFYCAKSQSYTVPRQLPYKDTRWVENTGVAGASYLNDSVVMFRNLGDTQMKPIYPAWGYFQGLGGDSTFWVWDMVRWKKLTSGGGGGGSNNTNLGSAYRWLNETSQGIKTFNNRFGVGIDSLIAGELSIGVDTSQIPTRYTIDSLGLLIPPFFSLTAIGNTPNANAASYNSTTGVFNVQPYSRAFGGVTTASATPQYAQGQKGWFSNTDTISTYYGRNFDHSLETIRSSLYGTGIQTWWITNGVNELGTLSYSTPDSLIGIVIKNVAGTDVRGDGRIQWRQYRDTGGMTWGAVRTGRIPGNQMVLLNNGHLILSGYTDSTNIQVDDLGYRLQNLYGGTTYLDGKLYLGTVADGSGSDSVLVIHNMEIKKVASGGGGSGTVTSVGLSMPSAFTVTNSPVTTSGTLTVTGAGTASQYIRGDGSLATLATAVTGAISLTASGSSGASTYNNSTGVLNIPIYSNSSLDTVNVSNVLAYGADSTGVVDATSAINTAIQSFSVTAAGKLRLYFPHGTYTVTVAALKAGSQTNKQGIQLINNLEIYGDGVGRTTIKAAAQATGDTSTYNWYPIFNGFTGSISNVKIHDLSINGNQANIAIYDANPYVNPTGHNDTSKHYSVQGIYFKDGINNEVYRVQIDSCQGFGVEVYNSFHNKIHDSKLTTNGNGGVGVTEKATADVYNNFVTNNNSDNIRVVHAGDSTVRVYNNDLSYAQHNASATNWFAGLYVFNTANVQATGNYVHDNSAYGIDYGGADSSTNGGGIIQGNYIFQNGNGGIAVAGGNLQVANNQIHDNGKTSNGIIDNTHSDYNPAAIVTFNAVNLTVTGNEAYDSISGTQTYFMKKATNSPSPTWGYIESTINNNRIKSVADTAHAYDGNAGKNSIPYNLITTSALALVPPAADKNFLTLTNGVPVWGAPFTLTTSGTSGTASFSGGILNIPNYSGGGGSVALSGITAATGTNTIDNLNFAQVWDNSTLSTQTFMTFSGNALTTGKLLNLTSTSTVGNGYSLLGIAASGANGTSGKTVTGATVSVTNTGTTSTNIGLTSAASGATTNYSIQSTAGIVDVQANGIANTSTNGLLLENTTAATSGVTAQFSPSLIFSGSAWKSNSTAASQTMTWKMENRPVTGSAAATSTFALARSNAGGGYVDILTVTSNTSFLIPTNGTVLPIFELDGAMGVGATPSTVQALTVNNTYVSGTTQNIAAFTGNIATTSSGTAFAGVLSQPVASSTTPNASANFVGVYGQMRTSTTNYSQAPATFGGVTGFADYSNVGSAAFPIIYGTRGVVNLSTGVTKDATKGYGLWSTLSANAATPSGRVVYYAGLRIDSIDNTNFTYAKPFAIDARGTNSYSFVASSGFLIGNYHSSGNDTATSTLEVNGSFATGVTSTAVDYTATGSDATVIETASGKTVTLPTAVGIKGRIYRVVYTGGSGTATIATTSSQTFTNITSAPTSLTLSAPAAGTITSYSLQSDDANWIVIGKVKNE